MTSVDKRRFRSLLLLLFGTVCISFAAIFVKLIDISQVGPTAIGFWRTLFGFAILALWTLAERRTLKLPPHVYKWAALAGFVFFLDLFLWHRSIIYCGAGMATILAGTQVFCSGILSRIFYKETLTARFFLAAFGGIVGVIMLIGVGSIELSDKYILGVILGLLTGITYANYILSVKRGSHEQGTAGTVAFMTWTSLCTAILLGTAALIEGEPMMPPDSKSYLVLFALGLIPQAIGWRAISTSLPNLDASRAALILLLQSVLATIWGFVFFGEYLNGVQMVGAVITLAAIYFGSIRSVVAAEA